MEFTNNEKLEELIKSYKEDITAEKEKALIEMLQDARLLLPVSFSDNLHESVENSKPGEVFTPEGQVGFDIMYLTGG